jgi:DNA-binding NarL/FixJ family response regulator
MTAKSTPDIVLVVDDSPDSVRLLTDVLDSASMTVLVATNGKTALDIATIVRPDIILMDAVMPVMDGFEACRRLKLLSGFDNVPVIFMTGLSEPEDSVRGFEAGGADFVTKPIVVDDLLARMRVHLSNAQKIKTARMALDAADQFLVATDRDGNILWFTPQAYRLLEERFGDGGTGTMRLPQEVLAWLRARSLLDPSLQASNAEFIVTKGRLQSRISFVGGAERREIVFRISDASPDDRLAAARSHFNLTQREAEVLTWLAQGKSNRDIASILALSPRTIDKHVEVIFAKMRVENRTAAAALLLQALGNKKT